MAEAMSWQRRGLGPWRRHILPVVIWLGASAAAGLLLMRRSGTSEQMGIAMPEQRALAALTDGRIRLLPVEVFAAVKAGQTLAVLEDERIQAALATATAEAVRLKSEVAAADDRLRNEAAVRQADYSAQARRYAVDVENERLREVELQVLLQGEVVRLEYLRLQRELYANLHAQAAVSDLKFQSADADFSALEKTVSERQRALAQVRLDLAAAQQRREEFSREHVASPALDQALAPLRDAITVQERRIDELATTSALLVLKAPLDGQVSQVLHGVGETVRAGEPIATIVATRPVAVVIYASPAQLVQFAPGTPVRLELLRTGWSRPVTRSYVQAVGPAAEPVPVRLLRNPAIPEWGWPVRIVVPVGADLLCGELIGVVAEGPGRSGGAGVAPVPNTGGAP